MQYYQIEDWEKNFETSESKKLVNLKWVAIKNTFDGRIYKRLLKYPDPARVFAVGILMAELASRAPRDHRGKIIDSDLSTGYTPEDMSEKTGIPIDDFLFAIPILMKIKWVSFWDGSRKISEISENIPLHNITLHNNTDIKVIIKETQDSPSALEYLKKVIFLNIQTPKQKEYIDIIDGCNKTDGSNNLEKIYRLEEHGSTEAMLFILNRWSALSKKYPKLNLYKLIQSKILRGFNCFAIAGMLESIFKIQHAPDNFYSYCEENASNPEILANTWETLIWPVVKKESVKLP